MNVGFNEFQHSQMVFPLWELESCDVVDFETNMQVITWSKLDPQYIIGMDLNFSFGVVY